MKTASLTRTTGSRLQGLSERESLACKQSRMSVSIRDDDEAIMRQARQIRASWSPEERQQRAEQGERRLDELCEMLFG